MHHHLYVFLSEHAFGRGGDGDGAVLQVESREGQHALLGKQLRMSLCGVATDDGALLATNDGGRGGRATVFWTDEEGFIHIVTACLQDDVDAALAAGVGQSAPLSCLSEGLVDALAVVHHDLTGSRCHGESEQAKDDELFHRC